GAGVVVLKRLYDAQRDGDRVIAVIRGVAMNNDGRGQGPLTPSADGQAAVMRDAWRDAGLDPASAGLLEAHATATQAGDASELAALAEVFGGAVAPVPVTSVKANIGHGLSSAGMASLLKAVCAVELGTIFPQPLSGPLRSELTAPASRLRVPVTAEEWIRNGATPRRAGVSAFGFGGTNVHVVLEEAPALAERALSSTARWKIQVSAPTADLLAGYARALAGVLRRETVSVRDVAYTLANRRRDAEMAEFCASDQAGLLQKLEMLARGERVPVATAEAVSATQGQWVSLPPSPLVERRFWLIDEARVSKSRTAVMPTEVAEVESVSNTDDTAAVIASICAVTAWRAEEIRMDQRFVADLGFDSLTTLEFVTALGKHLGGRATPPRALFGPSLTVGELTTWVITQSRISDPVADLGATFVFTEKDRPWLRQHRPEGGALLPLAAMMEAVQKQFSVDAVGAGSLSDFRVSAPAYVLGEQIALRVVAGDAGSFTLYSDKGEPLAKGVAGGDRSVLPALALDALEEGTLSTSDFYKEFGFHGPALQALATVPALNPTAIAGMIRGGTDAVVQLDGALQLALYFIASQRKQRAIVTGFSNYRQIAKWPESGLVQVAAVLTRGNVDVLRGDFDLRDESGELIAQWRGVEARVLKSTSGAAAELEKKFPELRELAARKVALAEAGFVMPYFQSHEGVAGATTRIEGRELVNFSSYNYLGLSGDSRVNRAVAAAVTRYGTSASASRVASGERPVHAELERSIAEFLGCGGALATVSGHSINVSLLGHLLGPEDVVIHDSLAHDSIVTGARLSGARRLVFPHNDLNALENLLAQERPTARRVLIAVEGVYSMDGDLAPLPEIVSLKKRYEALLLVDEAHSLGVLGATGAGAGEHFGVARDDVDFWMGTLSKTLASCGGYVAGDAALIDYLKFTMPGFIYSVGLSPANAAAALEALRLLRADAEPVQRLLRNTELFRVCCRENGVDIGMSAHSAVVPCMAGTSTRALRLAEALAAAGINVQPVFYPAVEEGRARLRFFITADHTEEQLRTTADLLGRELAVLNEQGVSA
ncbi:MAG: aminotransferase class I/II-fold pyridoxal phosphate-dependent enzyme, partial [Rariglobus sp.]